MDRHGDDADIPGVVDGLLEELETEQFEEPDNEHAEIAVSFGDWTLSVHVSGLVFLQDLSWLESGGTPVPPLYRWAGTREGVAGMLVMFARGEIEQLRDEPGWVRREELPARNGGDFFRRR